MQVPIGGNVSVVSTGDFYKTCTRDTNKFSIIKNKGCNYMFTVGLKFDRTEGNHSFYDFKVTFD